RDGIDQEGHEDGVRPVVVDQEGDDPEGHREDGIVAPAVEPDREGLAVLGIGCLEVTCLAVEHQPNSFASPGKSSPCGRTRQNRCPVGACITIQVLIRATSFAPSAFSRSHSASMSSVSISRCTRGSWSTACNSTFGWPLCPSNDAYLPRSSISPFMPSIAVQKATASVRSSVLQSMQ